MGKNRLPLAKIVRRKFLICRKKMMSVIRDIGYFCLLSHFL